MRHESTEHLPRLAVPCSRFSFSFIPPDGTRERPRATHFNRRPNTALEIYETAFQIARIAGTEVRIHITFLLFLAWIGFSYYQVGGAAAAVPGVLFIIALFACVLLHEFGHALAARAFGIPTPDITAFADWWRGPPPAHARQTVAGAHRGHRWPARECR